MAMFWKRRAEMQTVPAVPLTVSLALADLPTVPGPPPQLVAQYGARSGRQIRVQYQSSAKLGSLVRGANIDVIDLPIGTSATLAADKCLHQLGHLMMGHENCLGHLENATGDDRLQEVDATMFSDLVLARYRQVKRATGSQNPGRGTINAAYVLGTLDGHWPANVRETS